MLKRVVLNKQGKIFLILCFLKRIIYLVP